MIVCKYRIHRSLIRLRASVRTQIDLLAFIGQSKREDPKNIDLRAKIHLILAKKGPEIGFVATVCFAADLSLQNANSAEYIYAPISRRILILPA